ncbi:MAG: FKBP-type peptidyl-prolyl cis-trans isomerase [Candidatus Latescibacterota bacterium]
MKRRTRAARWAGTVLALAALAGCGSGGRAPGTPPAVQTEDDKALYAVGLAVATNGPLPGLFGPEEVALICEGFADAMTRDTLAVNMPVYRLRLNGYVQQRQTAAGDTVGGSGGGPSAAEDRAAAADGDSIEYALGVAVAGKTLQPLRALFAAPEVPLVARGLADGLLKRAPLVDLETYGPRLDSLLGERWGKRLAQDAGPERTRGQAYRQQAAGAPGAQVTASGLVYTSLREGTGPSPTLDSTVRVHYRGTLVDGTVFDTSEQRGPLEMPLRHFIAGWQEGVQMMKVGGRARLVVPPELAYGDQPRKGIPGGSTLVFELELLGIQ